LRCSQTDKVRCFDAEFGDEKWAFSLVRTVPTTTAVAGLDDDGKPECVFGLDRTLYCIGTDDQKKGRIK
jgi:hypothetical protein